MLCIIALIIFGILGIFSASYRKIAIEAFDCVFRRITFRKCRTNLDARLKSQLIGKVMRKSKKSGRFLYKYFEVFSWIFLILLVASMVAIGYGLYNYAKYGNCNGPESDQFCIFNGGRQYSAGNQTEIPLHAPDVSDELYVGSETAPITFIEFGCFSCHYTKKADPVVQEIREKYGDQIKFYFLYYPIKSHKYSEHAAIGAECARQQGLFDLYKEQLYIYQANLTPSLIASIDVGQNMTAFSACIADNATRAIILEDMEKGRSSGVYGTPTFFINGVPLVGPKSFDRVEKVIKDELKNS
ncbi:MAG: thioredoxin domain-containing protein [Nanoarchaeota archaeon]